MIDTRTAEWGAFALRVTLGVIMIAHACLKIFVFSVPGTVAFFSSVGFPGVLAYPVIAAELFGGIALVVGFKTRLAALGLVPVLLGATFVHLPNGWVFNAPNGGWEYPAFLTIGVIVQALLGSGALALDARRPMVNPALAQA
ncbi:DoxX family protein [Viridibacterium curvum]|uniref:DoxX family protein n=1 Tax=Viridibacterium curvum TaxID=1101404 RepID=A0ABP9QA77_9RHOO